MNIECVGILPALFQEVVVPPAVVDELASPRRPLVVRTFIAAPPAWLVVRVPATVESIPELHLGECQAIALATELGADLVLIDEQ